MKVLLLKKNRILHMLEYGIGEMNKNKGTLTLLKMSLAPKLNAAI